MCAKWIKYGHYLKRKVLLFRSIRTVRPSIYLSRLLAHFWLPQQFPTLGSVYSTLTPHHSSRHFRLNNLISRHSGARSCKEEAANMAVSIGLSLLYIKMQPAVSYPLLGALVLNDWPVPKTQKRKQILIK